MYTLISYPAGVIIEAVIVSRTEDRMRVVAAGLPDALELRRSDQNWLMESGEAIQFEFLAADSAMAREVQRPVEIARTAGA